MKKLGKLSINLNKVLKNEELVNIKGGNYDNGCNITCTGSCTGHDGSLPLGTCSITYLFGTPICVCS